jgi:low affinity Fe/Cu permease
MLSMARAFLTRLGVWSASPGAFVVVLVYGMLWAVLDPDSFDWHGVTTLVVWTMTLFIQRAEHRDTQAIHAKLDELLLVNSKARNEITELDHKEPEEIERYRQRSQRP